MNIIEALSFCKRTGCSVTRTCKSCGPRNGDGSRPEWPIKIFCAKDHVIRYDLCNECILGEDWEPETFACIKCGKSECQCIELSMGIPPETYREKPQ